jgi:polyvinyl alcohol dehydrogenase (cytochrome)
MKRLASILSAVLVALTSIARPATAQDGAALYAAHCSICHDGGVVRAPARRALAEMTAEHVLAALETGTMRAQAAERSAEERRAIAVFVSGKPLGSMTPPQTAPRCTSAAAAFTASPRSAWTGWSAASTNDRYQPQPGTSLTAADVPKLKLKWAFGFAGDTSAAVQPTVVDGRVFVGSTSGRVYALSLSEGCAYWTFDADTQVRTAIAVGRQGGASAQPMVFFADVAANIYSLDAATGQLRWRKKADDHPTARVTGTPRFADGRVYVPVSSLEELVGADPRYSCCTFRGSVVALDAASGDQIWKTYTIGETPKPTVKNKAGTQLFGPSGAAVWSSPTLDLARKMIYIGTGDSYTQPAAPTSDAIMALDLDTGVIKWVSQLTSGDAWNLACGGADAANCPASNGQDLDFGSPPMLLTLPSGEQRLIIGQKSGVVHGLDAASGKVLWSTRIGKGGVLGGVEWGSASDGRNAYVALSDQTLKGNSSGAVVIGQTTIDPNIGGGLFALRPADGTKVWNTPAPGCGTRPMCSPAQSAAVTAMPGIVFSGSVDGFLRAYESDSGRIVWEFDTARDFQTVNNVAARGGSIDVGGPAVAEGVVLTTSGYPTFGGRSGNVLLAFSVDGK